MPDRLAASANWAQPHLCPPPGIWLQDGEAIEVGPQRVAGTAPMRHLRLQNDRMLPGRNRLAALGTKRLERLRRAPKPGYDHPPLGNCHASRGSFGVSKCLLPTHFIDGFPSA